MSTLLSALARRNFFKQEKQRQTRVILMEALEVRYMFAADLKDSLEYQSTAVLSSLKNSILDFDVLKRGPNIQPNQRTSNAEQMDSIQIPADLPGSISYKDKFTDPAVANQYVGSPESYRDVLDNLALRLGDSNPNVPTPVKQLFGQMASNSSKQSLDIGSALTPESLIGLSFDSTSDHPQSIASDNTSPVQLGWFCTADGTSRNSLAAAKSPEGEDGDSIIPAIQIPFTYFMSTSDPNSFTLPSTGSGTNVSVGGSFTSAMLPTPDLDLPGQNWIHSVTTNYISESIWSFEEHLIYGFNLENGIATGEPSTLTVFHKGHLILSFYASRGMTTDPGAGVRWDADLDFRDAVGLNYSASSAVSITYDGVNRSLTETNSDYSIPNEVPDNYRGESSASIGLGFVAFRSGLVHSSSVPSLVSVAGNSEPVIERMISTTGTTDQGTSLLSTGNWSSWSRSGNLQTGSAPAPGDPISPVESDIVNSSFEIGITAEDIESSPEGSLSPVPEFHGSGHQHGALGGTRTRVASTNGRAWDIGAKIQDGELKDLHGEVTRRFESAFDDDFRDKTLYVWADNYTKPDNTGGWKASIVTGWDLNPDFVAGAGVQERIDLGYTPGEGVVTTSIPDDSNIDVDSNASAVDVYIMSLANNMRHGNLNVSSNFSIDRVVTHSGNALSGLTVTPSGSPSGESKGKWDTVGYEFTKETTTSYESHSDTSSVMMGTVVEGMYRNDNTYKDNRYVRFESHGDLEAEAQSDGNVNWSGTSSWKDEAYNDYHARLESENDLQMRDVWMEGDQIAGFWWQTYQNSFIDESFVGGQEYSASFDSSRSEPFQESSSIVGDIEPVIYGSKTIGWGEKDAATLHQLFDHSELAFTYHPYDAATDTFVGEYSGRPPYEGEENYERPGPALAGNGDWLDWAASFFPRDPYLTPVLAAGINATPQVAADTVDYLIGYADAFGDAYLDAVNPWNGVTAQVDTLDSVLVGGTKLAQGTAAVAASLAGIVYVTSAGLVALGYEATPFAIWAVRPIAGRVPHFVYQVGGAGFHATGKLGGPMTVSAIEESKLITMGLFRYSTYFKSTIFNVPAATQTGQSARFCITAAINAFIRGNLPF